MLGTTYQERRAQIFAYFDGTARETWKRLTSDAPLSAIRATVRAGREAMRETLLGWLPDDLSGRRILDAGCGTGLLALAAAARGAEVVGVDLSPGLIALARERANATPFSARITFLVGDMLADDLLAHQHGSFDHVIAMDSLIHYQPSDAVAAIAMFARSARRSVLVTFAPRTLALGTMHAVGRLFPRGNRAPAIVPVGGRALRRRLAAEPALAVAPGRSRRIARGFYISEALEMVVR
jgi:magnesium-protoporphyrin O-methyltransferase|uniref:Magnesium protoporphyrin IX methyltransferase n=1 Tax=Acidicaldus sp. TaxID=1872105 RepID=A0A8J4HC26_9PROT